MLIANCRRVVLALWMAVGAAGCGKSETVLPNMITVSPANVQMRADAMPVVLRATVQPLNAIHDLVWRVEPTGIIKFDVAMLDATKITVTPLAAGRATLTVTSKSNPLAKATVPLTVTAVEPATTITLQAASGADITNIHVGGTVALVLATNPANVDVTGAIFSVTPAGSLIRVDADGNDHVEFRAVMGGNAQIKAKLGTLESVVSLSIKPSDIEAITLTHTLPFSETGIFVNNSILGIDGSFTVTAFATPEDSNAPLVWDFDRKILSQGSVTEKVENGKRVFSTIFTLNEWSDAFTVTAKSGNVNDSVSGHTLAALIKFADIGVLTQGATGVKLSPIFFPADKSAVLTAEVTRNGVATDDVAIDAVSMTATRKADLASAEPVTITLRDAVTGRTASRLVNLPADGIAQEPTEGKLRMSLIGGEIIPGEAQSFADGVSGVHGVIAGRNVFFEYDTNSLKFPEGTTLEDRSKISIEIGTGLVAVEAEYEARDVADVTVTLKTGNTVLDTATVRVVPRLTKLDGIASLVLNKDVALQAGIASVNDKVTAIFSPANIAGSDSLQFTVDNTAFATIQNGNILRSANGLKFEDIKTHPRVTITAQYRDAGELTPVQTATYSLQMIGAEPTGVSLAAAQTGLPSGKDASGNYAILFDSSAALSVLAEIKNADEVDLSSKVPEWEIVQSSTPVPISISKAGAIQVLELGTAMVRARVGDLVSSAISLRVYPKVTSFVADANVVRMGVPVTVTAMTSPVVVGNDDITLRILNITDNTVAVGPVSASKITYAPVAADIGDVLKVIATAPGYDLDSKDGDDVLQSFTLDAVKRPKATSINYQVSVDAQSVGNGAVVVHAAGTPAMLRISDVSVSPSDAKLDTANANPVSIVVTYGGTVIAPEAGCSNILCTYALSGEGAVAIALTALNTVVEADADIVASLGFNVLSNYAPVSSVALIPNISSGSLIVPFADSVATIYPASGISFSASVLPAFADQSVADLTFGAVTALDGQTGALPAGLLVGESGPLGVSYHVLDGAYGSQTVTATSLADATKSATITIKVYPRLDAAVLLPKARVELDLAGQSDVITLPATFAGFELVWSKRGEDGSYTAIEGDTFEPTTLGTPMLRASLKDFAAVHSDVTVTVADVAKSVGFSNTLGTPILYHATEALATHLNAQALNSRDTIADIDQVFTWSISIDGAAASATKTGNTVVLSHGDVKLAEAQGASLAIYPSEVGAWKVTALHGSGKSAEFNMTVYPRLLGLVAGSMAADKLPAVDVAAGGTIDVPLTLGTPRTGSRWITAHYAPVYNEAKKNFYNVKMTASTCDSAEVAGVFDFVGPSLVDTGLTVAVGSAVADDATLDALHAVTQSYTVCGVAEQQIAGITLRAVGQANALEPVTLTAMNETSGKSITSADWSVNAGDSIKATVGVSGPSNREVTFNFTLDGTALVATQTAGGADVSFTVPGLQGTSTLKVAYVGGDGVSHELATKTINIIQPSIDITVAGNDPSYNTTTNTWNLRRFERRNIATMFTGHSAGDEMIGVVLVDNCTSAGALDDAEKAILKNGNVLVVGETIGTFGLRAELDVPGKTVARCVDVVVDGFHGQAQIASSTGLTFDGTRVVSADVMSDSDPATMTHVVLARLMANTYEASEAVIVDFPAPGETFKVDDVDQVVRFAYVAIEDVVTEAVGVAVSDTAIVVPVSNHEYIALDPVADAQGAVTSKILVEDASANPLAVTFASEMFVRSSTGTAAMATDGNAWHGCVATGLNVPTDALELSIKTHLTNVRKGRVESILAADARTSRIKLGSAYGALVHHLMGMTGTVTRTSVQSLDATLTSCATEGRATGGVADVVSHQLNAWIDADMHAERVAGIVSEIYGNTLSDKAKLLFADFNAGIAAFKTTLPRLQVSLATGVLPVAAAGFNAELTALLLETGVAVSSEWNSTGAKAYRDAINAAAGKHYDALLGRVTCDARPVTSYANDYGIVSYRPVSNTVSGVPASQTRVQHVADFMAWEMSGLGTLLDVSGSHAKAIYRSELLVLELLADRGFGSDFSVDVASTYVYNDDASIEYNPKQLETRNVAVSYDERDMMQNQVGVESLVQWLGSSKTRWDNFCRVLVDHSITGSSLTCRSLYKASWADRSKALWQVATNGKELKVWLEQAMAATPGNADLGVYRLWAVVADAYAHGDDAAVQQRVFGETPFCLMVLPVQ